MEGKSMRWIEVVDELPPDNKLVLCYSKRANEYFVGFFNPVLGWVDFEGNSKLSCMRWFDCPLNIPDEQTEVMLAIKSIIGEHASIALRVFSSEHPNNNSSE
jgi:hypothetical protein